jgi:hypothetical protein
VREKVIHGKDGTGLENADNKGEKDYYRTASEIFMHNSGER